MYPHELEPLDYEPTMPVDVGPLMVIVLAPTYTFYVGPFPDIESVIAWAKQHDDDLDFRVVGLIDPGEFIATGDGVESPPP